MGLRDTEPWEPWETTPETAKAGGRCDDVRWTSGGRVDLFRGGLVILVILVWVVLGGFASVTSVTVLGRFALCVFVFQVLEKGLCLGMITL